MAEFLFFLIITVTVLVAFDFAALRAGVDSREGSVDPRMPERRSWA